MVRLYGAMPFGNIMDLKMQSGHCKLLTDQDHQLPTCTEVKHRRDTKQHSWAPPADIVCLYTSMATLKNTVKIMSVASWIYHLCICLLSVLSIPHAIRQHPCWFQSASDSFFFNNDGHHRLIRPRGPTQERHNGCPGSVQDAVTRTR